MTKTCLYRHFDAEGQLLYVGISLSAIERLRQHKRSGWFDQIATVTIDRFPTREAARQAEETAIRDEGPLHNLEGRRRRTPVRTVAPNEHDGITLHWTKAALKLAEELEGSASM